MTMDKLPSAQSTKAAPPNIADTKVSYQSVVAADAVITVDAANFVMTKDTAAKLSASKGGLTFVEVKWDSIILAVDVPVELDEGYPGVPPVRCEAIQIPIGCIPDRRLKYKLPLCDVHAKEPDHACVACDCCLSAIQMVIEEHKLDGRV